jgi:TolA-binding protein
MTYILEHLKKDARNDLTTLIEEMHNTVEDLKMPSQKREQLKKNKERYNEVRAKQHLLEARIEPIKKKFAFIQDDANSESTMTELTEEEKAKLASLDELWGKFLKGMTEANAVIMRDYQTLKAEMDSSIDDFKKSV